jgi:hypothetical protein
MTEAQKFDDLHIETLAVRAAVERSQKLLAAASQILAGRALPQHAQHLRCTVNSVHHAGGDFTCAVKHAVSNRRDNVDVGDEHSGVLVAQRGGAHLGGGPRFQLRNNLVKAIEMLA